MNNTPAQTPSIVFVHGSGDSAACWQRQITFLGEERAMAVDLPGHGARVHDAGPPEMTVRDYALDVRQQMQAAGLVRPIVAGHSLGGGIALQLALEWGEELSGIILIGTGARLRVLPALLESAKNDQTETLMQIRGLARQPGETPSDPARAREAKPRMREPGDRKRPPPQAQALTPLAEGVFYRDLAACNVFDVMAEVSRITLPALVVCGEQDVMTPPKYAQYLQTHLPHATLRMIPEAGHDVMRAQPEALNDAIEEWLATTRFSQ